jgi:two-component system phosphate regulon sensor histidine kinase PhoR
MNLRGTRISRIALVSIITISLLIFLVSESWVIPGFSLPSEWRVSLIALVFFLIIVVFLVFRQLFIQPVKEITESLDDPVKLQNNFIKRKYLPHEIRTLYKAVLETTRDQHGELEQYHTDGILFSSILRSMSDGILIIDENGLISMINEAAASLFYLEQDKVIGLSIAEGLRDHRLSELYSKCAASQLQQSASLENPLEKTYIHCIATPLDPDLPGNILFLFQDFTRIRQLEIIRRDFVSNVSHELRTPLASLKLITETLQEGAIDDPPAARKFIKRMEGEVDNLSQMVEELLELSKIESGRVPLEKRWVNPAVFVRDSVERMTLQAERAGVQLLFKGSDDIPDFFADAPRLEQVLVNLLHNAIKFTQPGGRVDVSVRQDEGQIIFAIKDSGVGIPPKDLERIFERFYKADPSRSKRGTGLGLSIARHIVETHGGEIWAESQPGQGSTFFFRIPIL